MNATRRHRTKRGSALVITLSFIVLLAVVALGYLSTVAFERRISFAYTGKSEAVQFNQMAIDVATARIAYATNQELDQDNNPQGAWWISQPGRIGYTQYAPPNSNQRPTTQFVELYSGSAEAIVKDVSVNLNPPRILSPEGVIIGDTEIQWPVKWVYVTEKGEHLYDLNTPPTYNEQNRIIGRYAFWVDDDSTRINLNTASTGTALPSQIPADSPLLNALRSHPGHLNLTLIPPLNAQIAAKIRKFRNEVGPFNTLEQLKEAEPGSTIIEEVLKEHKDSLTHYSHASEVPRLKGATSATPEFHKFVLTTQKRYAGGRPFLDILTTDNADPGDYSNISAEKINAVFKTIFDIIQTKRASEWGLVESKSANNNLYNRTLASRYDSEGKGAAQLVLNIIEYVRAVESSQVLLQPIRGSYSNGVFKFEDGTSGANGYLGNSRRIHIVEFGLWLSGTAEPRKEGATVDEYPAVIKARIYLPPTAGAPINLTANTTNPFNFFYSIYPVPGSPNFTYIQGHKDLTAANIDGDPVIQPGEYRTIVIPDVKISKPISQTQRPTHAYIRLAFREKLSASNFRSYDIAPVYTGAQLSSKDFLYKIDDETVPVENITSISGDDPVINQCYSDWTNQGPNRFGPAYNTTPPYACMLGKVPTADYAAQQDTDENGLITNIHTIPPPPKGYPGNPRGMVESVAELGRVHNGGRGTSLPGDHWRSVRLQPRRGAINSMVPEWILFEIFEAPRISENEGAALQPEYFPVLNSKAGKINLNQKIYPARNNYQRNLPLKVLLRSLRPTLTEAQADQLVNNIVNKKTAKRDLPNGDTNNGFNYGTAQIAAENLYSFVGEVCEIEGIADTGEASEDNLIGLVDHLTTNSNVFSIYSIGQKVRQYASGRIDILGEVRTRTIVERLPDGKLRTVQSTEIGQ